MKRNIEEIRYQLRCVYRKVDAASAALASWRDQGRDDEIAACLDDMVEIEEERQALLIELDVVWNEREA